VTRLVLRASLLGAGAIATGASVVLAQQEFPQRPIRYIVPYPAGGSTTYTARLVGQRFTEAWGQQVVVDNRPGGNTIIGTQVLARSRPDGYTVGYVGSGLASTQLLHPTPYDGRKDFAYIASIASLENLLVVHPSVAATTLQEFIALAKARPGQINYATSSSGGSTHFVAELFNALAGIKTQQIPYKGGGPAVADLLGGQVQYMMAVPTNVIAHVKNGKLRALAVSGDTRLSGLPNVPTFTEAGVAGVALKTWHGVAAPAGTPKALVDKLSAEIGRLLALPDTREKLAAQGFDAYYNDPEQTTALIKDEFVKYAKIIREANIKGE